MSDEVAVARKVSAWIHDEIMKTYDDRDSWHREDVATRRGTLMEVQDYLSRAEAEHYLCRLNSSPLSSDCGTPSETSPTTRSPA